MAENEEEGKSKEIERSDEQNGENNKQMTQPEKLDQAEREKTQMDIPVFFHMDFYTDGEGQHKN